MAFPVARKRDRDRLGFRRRPMFLLALGILFRPADSASPPCGPVPSCGSDSPLPPGLCRPRGHPGLPRTPAPIRARSRSIASDPHRLSSRCPRRCSRASTGWRAAIGPAPRDGRPPAAQRSRRPTRRSRSPAGRRPISRVRAPLTFLLLSIPIPIAIAISSSFVPVHVHVRDPGPPRVREREPLRCERARLRSRSLLLPIMLIM